MTCIALRFARLLALAAALTVTVSAAAGQEPGPLGFLDTIFGDSDRFTPSAQAPVAATPAPLQQQERVAQAPAGELITRIDRLEAHIRQLTGAIEQLQHRNRQLETQLKRMQDETEYRLQDTRGSPASRAQTPPATRAPVLQQAPAQPQAPAAAQPGRRGDAFDPTQNPNAPGAPKVLGSIATGDVAQSHQDFEPDDPVGAPGGRAAGAPLDLSTLAGSAAAERASPQAGLQAPSAELPPPPVRAPSSTGTQVATLPPSDSPRDNYDLAYGYIQRKDYAQAEEGFRHFVRRFPSDRMAPDAHYWLGESMFQRQRYRDAAEVFLNVSTKYENAARAPDALLRLGQSLAALGEREAACASLAEVQRKYPRASVAVRQGVDREQKRARC
jgi:tol-pal system protein YbgF